MGRSPAEIEREIAETRHNLELRVVELRRQGRIQLQRLVVAGLVVAGVAAAVGGAVVVYRLTRPLTLRERARRLLPEQLERRARRARRGEQQKVVEEPEEGRWEGLAMAFAKAAVTAAGAAVVNRILQGGRKPAEPQE